jgi:hypothetical protein
MIDDTVNDSTEWPTADDFSDESVSSVGDEMKSEADMPEHCDEPMEEHESSEAKQPGPVPYSRFKQVNERSKALEQELMQLRHDQNEMMLFVKGILEGKQPQQVQDEPEYIDPTEAELKSLRQELNDLKGHREKEITSAKVAKLQSEIDNALSKYEHANPHEILLVLRQNPNLPVEHIAKRSHDAMLAKLDAHLRKMNPRQPKATLSGSHLTATKRSPQTWDDLTEL